MRIPMGNFGNAVAAPQEQVRISPQAAGQVGDALAGAGRTGMALASQAMDEQRREQEKADEELRRIQSVRAIAQTKNGLYELEDGISRGVLDGSIARGDATRLWEEGVQKAVQAGTQDLDPRYQESVRAGLLDTQFSLASRLRDSVTKRTQQEFSAELIGTREAMQRDATTDRAAANARWAAIVDSQGPLAGMTPEQIATDKQRFRESTAETEAYTIVNSAKNSMQALAEAEKRINGDAFADLDPQRRAVLNNTIAGARASLEQKAVIAAQRAELAAQRHERRAASAFDAVTKLATEGKIINPEYAAQVAQQVAGTAYAAALPQVLEQAKAGTAFATQPLAVQKARLDAFDAQANKQGWTPALQERRDALGRSYEASVNDYKNEPLRAAVERGVLPELAPLDTSGGVQGMVQGIAERVAQADTVEGVTGRPVSPLTSEEAGQLTTLLRALPADQKAATMATLASTLGPGKTGALAAQIDAKDRTLALLAAYGDQRDAKGGLVGEALMRGQQAIEDKRVAPADVTMWRSQIAEEVRGTYASTEMEDAVIDAAVLARASAEVTRDGRSVRRAVETAAGSIIEFNGGKIPLPTGMARKDFERRLVDITPDALADQAPAGTVFAGGRAVPLADFVRELPNAVLRHAGQGRYTVRAGTGSVLNEAGQPIIIRIDHGTR